MDVHGDALSEPARVDSLGVASFGVLGVLGVLATSGSVKLEGGFALPLKGSLRSSALPSGAAGVCGDMGGILVPAALGSAELFAITSSLCSTRLQFSRS